MKIRPVITKLSILFCALILVNCKTIPTVPVKLPSKIDYAHLWKEVDSLEKSGLPQSARTLVLKIKSQATAAADQLQYIKAVIYDTKFTLELEEGTLATALSAMEQELQRLDDPAKQILHSYVGELYTAYYQQNQWKLQDRTSQSERPEDITLMSGEDLITLADEHYLKSIAADGPLKTRLDSVQLLLTSDESGIKPDGTLYDLLITRALDNFERRDFGLMEAREIFSLNREELFLPRDEYIALPLSFSDSTDRRFRTLLVYQEALRKTSDSIYIDLRRLAYLHQNSGFSSKDTLYENSLIYLINNDLSNYNKALVNYHLASLYFSQKRLIEAHALCTEVLADYPGTLGARRCQQLLQQIEIPSLQVQIENVNLPDQAILSFIESKNLDRLFYRVVKLKQGEWDNFTQLLHEEQLPFLLKMEVVETAEVSLRGSSDFENHSTEVMLKPLSTGSYLIIVASSSEFDQEKNGITVTSFKVSGLAHSLMQYEGRSELFCFDRATGLPLSDVSAIWYQHSFDGRLRKQVRKKIFESQTNTDGYARTPDSRGSYSLVLVRQGDTLDLQDFYVGNYGWNRDQVESLEVEYYLDRSIYRPGQILYYKGILLRRNNDGIPQPVRNHALKVSLYDANSQLVSTFPVISNALGSFTGSFILPSEGLLGQMSIGIDNTHKRHYFHVEEYRRPSFEVEIDSLKSTPKLGDELMITGSVSSYAGAPLAGIPVVFRVVRKSRYPFFHFYSRYPVPASPEREIAYGVIQTDKEGRYSLSFVALADDLIEGRFHPVFDYEIRVDATDISGESQSGRHTITLADKPYGVQMDSKKLMNLSREKNLKFSAITASGNKLRVDGTATFFLMDETSGWLRPRYWALPDQTTLSVNTFRDSLLWYSYPEPANEEPQGREISRVGLENIGGQIIADFSDEALPAGQYRVRVQTNNEDGVQVQSDFLVHLVDPGANFVPQDQLLYVLTPDELFQPGDTATINVGAALSGKMLYRIERASGLEDFKWLPVLHWSQVKIPITEADRGGVFVHLQFTYQNRIVRELIPIRVPWSNKDLGIKIQTLRDKTRPGNQEEVELQIIQKNKGLANVELLASMYDASLDALHPHNWPIKFFMDRYSQLNLMTPGFEVSYARLYYWGWNPEQIEIPTQYVPQLNWFGFQAYRPTRMAMDAFRSKEISLQSAVPPEDRSEAENIVSQQEPVIRENFNENLFFYPQLIPDEQGKVSFKYQSNDALTTWRLMLFAHSDQLASGYFEAEIISQKELMITSNRPRFLRSGDVLSFSSKIDNLTTDAIQGKAKLDLKNALSGQSLNHFIDSPVETSFSIDARSSGIMKWSLSIPDTFHFPVEYTVTATSENYQDAERAIIPVLENRMLVTSTRAFEVKGGETRNFDFQEMIKEGSEVSVKEQLVYDFTANPAWYAIKALPYLMEFPYECSEQIFNRLFANTLGLKIIRENPSIKRIFAQWKSINLQSPLFEDEELKSATIEETPWLQNALSESDQMKRLALYFEPNTLQRSQMESLHKLQRRQAEDGGFAWFPGGTSNWFITQYILEGLIEMQEWVDTEMKEQIDELIHKGIVFLDEQAIKNFQNLEKMVKTGTTTWDADHLSPIMINYLHVKMKIQKSPSVEIVKVQNYYLDQAIKYWTKQPLYSQAILVLIFNQNSKLDARDQVIRSLKERVIVNPDLGAYWKYVQGFHWWQMPIETQAKMIEVFSDFGQDPDLVNQLRRWLLNHKRTNHWNSTKSTAEAIRALTLGPENWLAESAPLHILIGNVPITPDDRAEAGTLQRRLTFKSEEIDRKTSLSITNPNANPAWGSASYQYFENLDRIRQDDNGALSVVKNAFLESHTDRGMELKPIEDHLLTPGDIVRIQLEIETDRDMEFIHLKDQRGAALEPLTTLSGYEWNGGLGFYRSNTDLATNYFIDMLPKGKYVLQYSLRVSQTGRFSAGNCTIQSMYAPEFAAHTEGVRFQVGSIQ